MTEDSTDYGYDSLEYRRNLLMRMRDRYSQIREMRMAPSVEEVEQRVEQMLDSPVPEEDTSAMYHRAAVAAQFKTDPMSIPESEWSSLFNIQDPVAVDGKKLEELKQYIKEGVKAPIRPGWLEQIANAVPGAEFGRLPEGGHDQMKVRELGREAEGETGALAAGLQAMMTLKSKEEIDAIIARDGKIDINPLYLSPKGRQIQAIYDQYYGGLTNVAEEERRRQALKLTVSELGAQEKVVQAAARRLVQFRTLGAGEDFYSANRPMWEVVESKGPELATSLISLLYTSAINVTSSAARGLAQVGGAVLGADEIYMAQLGMPWESEAKVAAYRKMMSEIPVEGESILGKATDIAGEISATAIESAIKLWAFQALSGVNYGKAATWKDSFLVGLKKNAIPAAKFAGFSALTEPGDDRERLMAGLTAFAWGVTPAFSRMSTRLLAPALAKYGTGYWADKMLPAFTDMLLNITATEALTDNNYHNALALGMEEARENGESPLVGMIYGALHILPILPMDIIPSLDVRGAAGAPRYARERAAKQLKMTPRLYKEAMGRLYRAEGVVRITGENRHKWEAYRMPVLTAEGGRPFELYPRAKGKSADVQAKNKKVLEDISPAAVTTDEHAAKIRTLLEGTVDGFRKLGVDVELCPTRRPDIVNPASPEGEAQLRNEGYTEKEIAEAKQGLPLASYSWIEPTKDATGKPLIRLFFAFDGKYRRERIMREGFSPNIRAEEQSHETGHMLDFIGRLNKAIKGEMVGKLFEKLYPSGMGKGAIIQFADEMTPLDKEMARLLYLSGKSIRRMIAKAETEPIIKRMEARLAGKPPPVEEERRIVRTDAEGRRIYAPTMEGGAIDVTQKALKFGRIPFVDFEPKTYPEKKARNRLADRTLDRRFGLSYIHRDANGEPVYFHPDSSIRLPGPETPEGMPPAIQHAFRTSAGYDVVKLDENWYYWNPNKNQWRDANDKAVDAKTATKLDVINTDVHLSQSARIKIHEGRESDLTSDERSAYLRRVLGVSPDDKSHWLNAPKGKITQEHWRQYIEERRQIGIDLERIPSGQYSFEDIRHSFRDSYESKNRVIRQISIEEMKKTPDYISASPKEKKAIRDALIGKAQELVDNLFASMKDKQGRNLHDLIEQYGHDKEKYIPQVFSPLVKNMDRSYILSDDAPPACLRSMKREPLITYLRKKHGIDVTKDAMLMKAMEIYINGNTKNPITCAYCYDWTRRAIALTKSEAVVEALRGGKKIESPLMKAALKEAEEKPSWEKDFENLPELAKIRAEKPEVIGKSAVDFAKKYPAIWKLKNEQTSMPILSAVKQSLNFAGRLIELPNKIDDVTGRPISDIIFEAGGFRSQSKTDYHPMFLLDKLIETVEMNISGTPGHVYMKEILLARLLRDSGWKMQFSAVPMLDKDGNMVMGKDGLPKANPALGSMTDAELKEAAALAPEHGGAMWLIPNDKAADWLVTTENPNVHFGIMFHFSGMKAEVAQIFRDEAGWQDYGGQEVETPRAYSSKEEMPEHLQKIAIKQGGKWYVDLRQATKALGKEFSWLEQDAARKEGDAAGLKFHIPQGKIISWGMPESAKEARAAGMPFPPVDDRTATQIYFEWCEHVGLEPQFKEYLSRYMSRHKGEKPPFFWRLKKHFARTDTPFRPPDPTKIDMDEARRQAEEYENSDFAKTVKKITRERGGISPTMPEVYAEMPLDRETRLIMDKFAKLVQSGQASVPKMLDEYAVQNGARRRHVFRNDVVRRQASLDEDANWRINRRWIDADGNIHIGEPGGEVGASRASLSPEQKDAISPSRDLGAKFYSEADAMPSPALQALGPDMKLNPLDKAVADRRFAEARMSELAKRPLGKTLSAYGAELLPDAPILQNKAKTSIYPTIITPQGYTFVVRFSGHEPTPGQTEARYPYDFYVMLKEDKPIDLDSVAGMFKGEDFVKELRMAVARKDAEVAQAQAAASTPEKKYGLYRWVKRESLALYRAINSPSVHFMRILETTNPDDLLDPWYNGWLSRKYWWFNDAENVRFAAMMDIRSGLENLPPIKDWDKPKYEVMVGGKRMTLSTSDLISIYMHQRDETGRAFLMDGFVFDRPRRAWEKEDTAIHQLDEAEIDAIVKEVEYDPNLNQLAQAFASGMLKAKAYLAATSMQQEGRDITRKGLYWTLEFREHGEKPRQLLPPGSHLDVVKELDMTNQAPPLRRREGGGKVLVVGNPMAKFMWYSDIVARYTGHAPVVNRINALMANKDYRDLLKNTLPDIAVKWLEDLVADYNEGGRPTYQRGLDRFLSKWASKYMSQFTTSKLVGNLSAPVMQMISYETARPFLSLESFAYGYAGGVKPAPMDHMIKFSPYFRERYGNVGAFTESFVELSRRTGFGWQPIVKGDWFAVGRIWNAARHEIQMQHPELKGDALEYATAKLTERITSLSQSPTRIAERPWLLRIRSPLARAIFGLFTSQTNANYGEQLLLGHAMIGYLKMRNAKGAAGVIKTADMMFHAMLVQWIFTGIVQSLAREARLAGFEAMGIIDEDSGKDRPGFLENMAMQFGMNALGDRGMVINRVAKEAYSAMFGKQFSGMITPTLMRIGQSSRTLANENANWRDQERARRRLAFEILSLADTFLGTGLVSFARDSVGLVAVTEKAAEGEIDW